MSDLSQVEQYLLREDGASAASAAVASLQAVSFDDARVREVGHLLARLYHELHAKAVYEFLEAAAAELPQTVYEELTAPLKADIEATREWTRRLDELANERLQNELIDRVKANDMASAEAGIIAFISAGSDEAGRARRGKQIGNALGGLVHEKDRAQAIVRNIAKTPMKFGLDLLAATDVEEEYARSNAATARRERPASTASRVQLTEAAVELGRTLPPRNALHEPTPEDLERFDRAIRAIFRSALVSPAHYRFHEATLLMVEFSAKEVSAAGALAGVEQRLYGTLGRTSRAVAAQVFKRLGENMIAFSNYQHFAQHHRHAKVGHFAVEALGLLANPAAVPFLLEVLNDKRADSRTEAIFALGSVANVPAQNALLQALSHDLRNKPVEGNARRDAFSVISALGRAVRGMTDMQAKTRLITQVVRVLPKEDLEFPVRAVLNFFVGKLEGMDSQLLNWAAQVGTTALWSIDRPELARAGRAQPLGFRQPLIDLLARLAPFALPAINQTALAHAKAYSGAYLAMGELYGKHPDPSAVPVIRQLLMNVSLHDDSRKSEYVKETVLDTATDERTELSKDRVIASLVYALDKIDSPEATALMADIFEQIQSGRLPTAGTETAEILMKAHMRAQQQAGRATMAPGTTNGGPATGAAATQVTEQDLEYISDLEASYLLAAKRRAKKIAAMAALAQRKIGSAVKIIVAHLTDSDPLIASAAATALQDMGSGPTAQTTLDTLHRELVAAIVHGDNALKVKVAEVIMKLGPSRSPLKERLEKLAATPNLPPAAKAIVSKLTASQAGGAENQASHRTLSAEELQPEKLGAAAQYMPKAGGASAVSDLDKKRAYMQARQAWIRGGKRGPEPQMPE